MAGAAATTRHATNSLYGDGGIMWKLRGCVSVEPKEPLHTDRGPVRAREVLVSPEDVCRVRIK